MDPNRTVTRPASRRPAPAAFTLVELLVVIGIIALLVGILLPSLGRAQASARRTACAAGLREVGNALQMYLNDHRGRFPETTHTAGVHYDRAWVFTLAPYLSDVHRVRICPDDPRGGDRLAADGSSYVLNEYVAVPGPDEVLVVTRLRRASEFIVAFEVADRAGASVFSDHTHSRNWFKGAPGSAWNRVCADVQPNRHGGGGRDARTSVRGAANHLFADGHVEAIAASQLKGWADTGHDFARPPP